MLSDNPTLEEVASYFANDQFATVVSRKLV